jgi:hypothetical protein
VSKASNGSAKSVCGKALTLAPADRSIWRWTSRRQPQALIFQAFSSAAAESRLPRFDSLIKLKRDYNAVIIVRRNGMARPENRSEARSLSLTLPEETFNYLVLLAGLGKLGRTENEVATHILVRETYAMIERGFHERKIPAATE